MIKFQPSKSEKVVISFIIEDYKLEEIDKIKWIEQTYNVQFILEIKVKISI